ACPGSRSAGCTRCARRRRRFRLLAKYEAMFDLRYHVASLAAVFLALIIGILVGVGISSGGFIKKSERSLLNQQIADLRGRLDAATRRASYLSRTQRAAQAFVQETYPALIAQRLKGKRVAVVFVGPADDRMR